MNLYFATFKISTLSIPESEYFHEKQQYAQIIDQLTEENMVMRRIIGRLKSDQEGNEPLNNNKISKVSFRAGKQSRTEQRSNDGRIPFVGTGKKVILKYCLNV